MRGTEQKFITISQLEKHIYDHFDVIVDSLKAYGYELSEVSEITNYYDLAALLELDSRLLETVEIELYAEYAQGLLEQIIEE